MAFRRTERVASAMRYALVVDVGAWACVCVCVSVLLNLYNRNIVVAFLSPHCTAHFVQDFESLFFMIIFCFHIAGIG